MPRIPTAKQTKRKKQATDTTTYEIEKIVGHKIIAGILFFVIKWMGFSTAENTEEPVNRLMANSKLKEFGANKVLKKNYHNTDMKETLLNSKGKKDFSDFEIYLGLIGQQFICRSTLTYVENSPLHGYRRFVAALFAHENEWCLNTIPDLGMLVSNMRRYCSELSLRLIDAPNYPNIQIYYGPATLQPTHYIPPPPPHFVITMEQLYEDIDSEVKKSKDQGFGCLNPFIEQSEQDKKKKLEMLEKGERLPGKLQYPELLILQYFADSGWVLLLAKPVKAGTELMEMFGVIRDSSTAHESCIENGFPTSHSSIFQLDSSGRVLDQTYNYDFSKFITHSCDPNCDVKLVRSSGPLDEEEEPIPHLIISANQDIETDSTRLSIDFYKGFEEDVDRFFADIKNPILKQPNGRLTYLHDKNIGFVGCTCHSQNCRQVLFVETAMIGHDESERKEVLKNLPVNKQFKGSRIDIGYL